MQRRNIFDLFRLSKTVSTGFAQHLPFHPLQLVAAENAGPKLVISYDHHPDARVVDYAPRVQAICTHVNLTLLPGAGAAPLCYGFGAASLVETYEQGVFRRANPYLQADDIYEPLNHLPQLPAGVPFKNKLQPLWNACRTLLHPSLKECVAGQLIDESWRIADSFITIDVSARQMRGAQEMIDQWQRHPPYYEVRSLIGSNCKDFVREVIEFGAEIAMPAWWLCKPWPGKDARFIERKYGRSLFGQGPISYQPSWITKQMAAAALGIGEAGKTFARRREAAGRSSYQASHTRAAVKPAAWRPDTNTHTPS